jgi:hypothetical protein
MKRTSREELLPQAGREEVRQWASSGVLSSSDGTGKKRSTVSESGAGIGVSPEEEAMQMTSKGHVQRSAAQWSELIAQYRQSGLGMKEFWFTLWTLKDWYRRQRRTERSKGQFVELTPPRVPPSPWAVEVEFPHGVRLLASAGVFEEQDNGAFALTALGVCLRAGVPGSVRALVLMSMGERVQNVWRELVYCVRTGEPRFRRRGLEIRSPTRRGVRKSGRISTWPWRNIRVKGYSPAPSKLTREQ